MKNRICALLALIAALALTTGAMAEGRIEITRENYHLNDDADKAYVFVKVTNTGDAAIRVADSNFELLDADGKALESTESMKEYADYLQPGEYTYASAEIDLDDVEGEVASYRLTINGKDGDKYTSVRLDAKCEWNPEDSDEVLLTVANNTGDILYGVKGAVCFSDAAGDILTLNAVSMLSKVGLNPGSTVTMKVAVPSDFHDAVVAAGRDSLVLDAIAYANVKN